MSSRRKKKFHSDAPTARERTEQPKMGDRTSRSTLEHAHHRLEHLYEISKLFANFDNVDQTFDTALAIATKTLPLQSAILIEVEDGHSKMILWPSKDQDSEEMRAAKAHVETAYAYLVGSSSEALDLHEQSGRTLLPPQARVERKSTDDKRYIVIPLVIRHRAIFGALQLEAASFLDKTDVVFVNAIANQLAVALDRDRAWRRDIRQRDHAEGGRAVAEEKGANAEQKRVSAEALSAKFEALALENRRLYEQAQEAIRVREQILAIVSHDLKNPLAMILLATASLAKRSVPEERRKGLSLGVTRIERATQRMQRLIEDLLDFASIEAGRLSLRHLPQEPASLIDETLASFETVAQGKRLRLNAALAPGLPEVFCDRDRILQVISNLVGNATKVTAEGGVITLRVEAGGNEVIFAVSDSGPGIGEEDLTQLFERYWRSSKAQYRGTGLGLAIARGIVNAHGGRIWAESQVGRGSTFYFTIPAVDADHPPPAEPAPASHAVDRDHYDQG